MPGKPNRMVSPETAREIAAIIETRLAQGLTKALIAKRLGISPQMVVKHLERGAKLAKESREA